MSQQHGFTSTALGQSSSYGAHYDPTLLQAIPRAHQRQALGLLEGQTLPFLGADLWTGYELGWLNMRGKPQVGILQLTIPCETPNLVESKSLKLYLNGFNQTPVASADELREIIARDLSAALWSHGERNPRIGVRILTTDCFDAQAIEELSGLDLDRLDIDCDCYTPQPDYLTWDADAPHTPITQTLSTRLLKSNCLVTGQPDWGSLLITYTGRAIDQAGLLRYIVSFRQHQEFHEHCVERIYLDILNRLAPTRLSVFARYTRRGGLDIAPYRSNSPSAPPSFTRTARQ